MAQISGYIGQLQKKKLSDIWHMYILDCLIEAGEFGQLPSNKLAGKPADDPFQSLLSANGRDR